METFDSTEGSQSRSLQVLPSSEGLGSSSEPFPSSDGGPNSALATATAAAAAAAAAASTAKAAVLSAKIQAPSSDSLLGKSCTGPNFTNKIGLGRLGFNPVCVSHVSQDPCTANDLSCSPGPVPGSSSGPGSGCGSVPGSSSGPGHDSGPGCGSGRGNGLDSGPGPACESEPSPGYGNKPELSPYPLRHFGNPRVDMVPNYAASNHYQHWEPQKQPWKILQVSEPAAPRLWKSPKVEGKSKILNETLPPRGQCLLYNWEEERATNYLDQVPSMQDGSESFYFRRGHQGLLTVQLQSPMPLSSTQKDSYQPPGNYCQPVRGKREAMLEMFLRHQICLTTTIRSSLKLSGYRGHHSYRVSVTSGHWTHHSGRTAASQHQCLCPWGSLCPMNLRIIPTNWEKSLPLAVREEGRLAEGVVLSKG
ncbi:sperm-associated antigen 8 isoform 3-T3 [Rhynchonycteris naso]